MDAAGKADWDDDHTARRFVLANTFSATQPEEIDREAVADSLSRHAFACLTGLFSSGDIAAAHAGLKAGFSPARDHPAQGEEPGAVMSNFQKVAVGGAMQSWAYRPRFMRIIYNPIWAPDIYGMRKLFTRLAQIRNQLLGYAPNFATNQVEKGLWTAARIQHYPAGGGFLIPHRDTVTPIVTKDAGQEQYYQLLLLLTAKGEDFAQGGGFVETEGKRIIFEDHCPPGTVIIYDGSTVHGVADIDPHKLPDLTGLSGRLVAFASLYKDMSADDRLFETYDKSRADDGVVPLAPNPGRKDQP